MCFLSLAQVYRWIRKEKKKEKDSSDIILIFHLFLQMTGKDKDYRYMATSDLLNELNKEGFKADSDLEIKLSNIILQQLDDVAGDVSGLAVKW